MTLGQIAVDRPKSCAPSTILNHIWTAALNGFPVPWQRLVEFLPPKSKADLCDENISEEEIMDSSCALKPFFEKMEEKVTYDQLRTYMTLKRIGFPMQWKAAEPSQESNPAKRQRVA